jgi:hypothetical protein
MAVQEITPALADTRGLERPADIIKGEPAERGAIIIGDIITEYDGKGNRCFRFAFVDCPDANCQAGSN